MTTANNDYNAAQYPADALAADSSLNVINTHDASTLDELFRERVRRSPDKVAYTQFDVAKNQWVSLTWSGMATQVERWQVGLRDSGLKKGDRVAICYANSIEWVVFDQAALRLGLVVVPLYTADRADNMAYVISDSGAKLVLFTQAATWKSVAQSNEDTSSVEHALVFSGETGGIIKQVDQWLPEHGAHFERGLAEPDDLASIVYTSGTTGRPKGVMLSHKNMLSNAYNGMRSVALKPTDKLLSFLPLSHTFERTVGYYAALMSASEVTFNRSIAKLNDDLIEVKPTLMISVPRIFERVQNKINADLANQSAFKQWMFKTTLNVGWHKFMRQQGKAMWHPRLLLSPILDSLVSNKIRQKLGGRLNYVIVGGARLTEGVAKTFISLGVPLLQGYGLTESSPVVSVNTLEKNRLSTIGLLLRGVQVKIMDKDELWVKGDNVMQGYWNMPEATEKTIVEEDGERWLKTGDRATIDEEGFVKIIGRIKDILVLANGEKVPPPDIEEAIARNPLFEQVMVVGEGKSFLTVLTVLNPTAFSALCKDKGFDEANLKGAPLQKYLVKCISEQMTAFPGYAKVRKVHVCEDEWTVESGLLTPTLKLKRSKVLSHYADEVEQMYLKRGAPV